MTFTAFAPPVGDVTRCPFAGILAASALLAGCGSDRAGTITG